MKSDIVLKIIDSLLIPILLIIGFLVIADYKVFGFFAIISSVIFFLIAYILYYLRYGKIKPNKLMFFQSLTVGIVTIFIFLLIYVMLKLINFL
jgi:hypothetical protein